ncbi:MULTISPECIES: hypothetical protein [unclassified Caballeronia]|uniref:hypothetical protein n=1 Tax=unclassified Caballeronia TaxID=2646786 RepID=UPI00285BCF39|nr:MULTISPECIES: hypothetical protein [unclassified Caballeronia]MDR5812799.1 hypothetical protein [Caballeronia sp. LZ033]MDR5819652.1 hypothetical protein [Caballeronia sp. LZ043]MDR5877421.1 hypothetical protein [Caballeronia sp. LZ032]
MKHSKTLTACALAACSLMGSTHLFAQTALPPGHPDAKQLMAAEGVMTSASLARGAADVCHIDAAKIARFKDVVHTSYPDAPDFDGEWKLGLAQAQSTVDRFARLKASQPAEYKKEIGEACPALARGIDEVTAQPPQ